MREAALMIAVVSCGFDLRTRRIPNALTFAAAAAGLGVNAAVAGAGGAAASAAGCLIGIALFLPMFLLRGMGGGDVKLLGALGAWVGPVHVFEVALWSTIAGAVIAFGIMVVQGSVRSVLRNVLRLIHHWRRTGLQPLPDLTLERAAGPRLAYAVPVTAGLMVALWLR